MTLQERINRIFNLIEANTFPEMLEIPEDVWARLQEIARSKNFILTDTSLRTSDGKTLVTLDTEDSWKQLMTYLELENLADTPIRELTIGKLGQAKVFPPATMKQVTITATLGADAQMPVEDEMKEIITANLKPINARVHGNLQVIKQNASIIIKLNMIIGKAADDNEIERLLKTNLDKIITITNIEVKDVIEKQ